MIQITRGELRECVFTLSEKVTIDDPYYIFQLINTEDPDEYTLFTEDDISLSTDRYNSFEILAGTGCTGCTGSTPTFDLEQGVYDYVVYQSATSSLEITDCVLETGLLKILDGPTIEYVSYDIISVTAATGGTGATGATGSVEITETITVIATETYNDDEDEFTYYG